MIQLMEIMSRFLQMLSGVTTTLAACNYTSVEDRKMVWKEQNRMHVQKSDTQRSSCSISIVNANHLLSLRWPASLSASNIPFDNNCFLVNSKLMLF